MEKPFKFILRDARVQVLGVLLLVWSAAIYREPSWENFIYPLYATALLSALDLGFTYLKTKKWYYSFSSLVSGLLIGFLIHYSQGFLLLTFAVILAFLSKQFIKIKGRHIFNPAALGAVVSGLLLGTNVSWWAVAPGGISMFFMLLMIPIIYKLRRLGFTLIFLSGYFFFFLATRGIYTALPLTFDGTVFLFSFVMLTEPMTSSIANYWRWLFGIMVFAVFAVLSLLKISFTDPLLFSLLLTNFLAKIASK